MIGYVLSTGSMCNGIVQALLFGAIVRRWQAEKIFAASMITTALSFTLMPIMNILAQRAGQVTPLVWCLIVLEETTVFPRYLAHGKCHRYKVLHIR